MSETMKNSTSYGQRYMHVQELDTVKRYDPEIKEEGVDSPKKDDEVLEYEVENCDQ